MNEKVKRSPLLRSKTICKKKVDAIIIQLKNIPNFWKKKFIQDNWQLVLTDKMPQEYGGLLGKVYSDGNKKQTWLNVEVPDIYSNIVYIAFAYYVSIKYAQLKESNIFAELVERNERELTLFLIFRGNIPLTKAAIFGELFSFVIETNGKNSLSKIDEPYQYVKKWVYGRIFDRNLTFIPDYIEVDLDVIDEQIEMADKAFKSLPQKLQKQFLMEKWKIIISDKNMAKDSTYGLCSTFERRIFIRSSSHKLVKTIWHEFGHYLDYKERFPSHSRFFETVFNKERMSIRNLYDSNGDFEYGISNCEEYFAEIFAFYMMDSETLKECAFGSFNIINDEVKRWR